MGTGQYIGQVGALAVALGIGAAVATTPGVALADPDCADSSSSSDNSSPPQQTGPLPDSETGPLPDSAPAAGSSLSKSPGSLADSASKTEIFNDPRRGIVQSSRGAHTSGKPAGDTPAAAPAVEAGEPTQTAPAAGDPAAAPAVEAGEPTQTAPAAGDPAAAPAVEAGEPTQTAPAAGDPAATEPVPVPDDVAKPTAPQPPVAATAPTATFGKPARSWKIPTGVSPTGANARSAAVGAAASPQTAQGADTPNSAAPDQQAAAATVGASSVPQTTSVVSQVGTAAPAAPTAQMAPAAATATSSVSGVVADALTWVGLRLFASDSPVAPVQSPLAWAMLAWCRRQCQQALVGETPAKVANPAQTSLAVDTAAATGAVSDPPTVDGSDQQTFAVASTMALAAPVTLDVAEAAVATPPAVQVNAATPIADVQFLVDNNPLGAADTTTTSAQVRVTVANADTTPAPDIALYEIDGGSDYYTANGWTYAADAGWDAPGFFPTGLWLAGIHDQDDADRWIDLGLNTMFPPTGNTDLDIVRDNGLWVVADAGELDQYVNGPVGAETVGLLAIDEPSTVAAFTDPVENTPNALQDNRFWWLNMGHNPLQFGDIGGSPTGDVLYDPITTPNATTRHMDITSTDLYWFAGAEADFWRSVGGELLQVNPGGQATVAEMSHGQHYGFLIDWLRSYTTPYPGPIFQFIEVGGPYTENTSASNYITPPEINSAVWNSIIHGARGIVYFNHTFAGPAESNDSLADEYFQTVQAGQSISIYDQIKATNTLITTLAPVINSPSAPAFLSSVTPAPPTFTFNGTPTVVITGDLFTGIDTAVKYYAADGKFYIFASNRSTTSTLATFTLNGVTSGTATVIDESRSIPITAGVFTDTFADHNTIHIYQINGA